MGAHKGKGAPSSGDGSSSSPKQSSGSYSPTREFESEEAGASSLKEQEQLFSDLEQQYKSSMAAKLAGRVGLGFS